MYIFSRWIALAISILIVSLIVPGVSISGIWAALWVALFLSVVNIILKPFLILITLPINILTLGLFTFVINALLVLLISTIIKGFAVSGLWPAILFSIFLSVVSYILNKMLYREDRHNFIITKIVFKKFF